MKRIFKLTFILVWIVLAGVCGLKKAIAQDDSLVVHFFYGHGCPHCVKESTFLDNISEKYKHVEFRKHEVGEDEKNSRFFQQEVERLNIDSYGVPLIIIEDEYIVGYRNDETTGKEIVSLIDKYFSGGDEIKNDEVSIPVFGKIDAKTFSLPLLSIVLGVVDGFNPCALWTLLFLISLLLNMKDRKRMWILGTAFIVTSAFIYLLFMTAWLNFFLLVGYIKWIRILIGIFALGAAGYNFYDFFTSKKGGCKVVGGNKKRLSTLNKIKELVKRRSLVLALVGIVVLAVVVNMVEMLCSAGLPAIFSQVLSLNNLTPGQYLAYMVLYVLFFMIDDLFIFFSAMITLQATGIQHKYARFSRLVGGIVILVIGVLLIFRPGALMMG